MKTAIIFVVFLLLTSINALAQPAHQFLTNGNAYKARGDLLRAEGQYRLALELNPDLSEAYAGLGEICVRRKQFTKAIGYFEKALALGHKKSSVFVKLAFSHRMAGDLDRAIEVYRMFAETYPDLAEPYLGLGGLYDAKGMKTEAEEAYRVYTEMKAPRTSSKKVEGR